MTGTCAMPGFYGSTRESNPGPHAYVMSPLPSEQLLASYWGYAFFIFRTENGSDFFKCLAEVSAGIQAHTDIPSRGLPTLDLPPQCPGQGITVKVKAVGHMCLSALTLHL